MKAAYVEVLSDMVTSMGVIAAAIVIMATGWYYADPLVLAGIECGGARAWKLLRGRGRAAGGDPQSASTWMR